MRVVDSHCHLDFPELAREREAVLARAEAAGVTHCLTISTHFARTDSIIAIAESIPQVFCSIGVHPHHCGEEGELVTEAQLLAKAAHPKVIGLGETGLDYHYHYSPVDVQKESFRRHVRASKLSGLPIIIHAREADADVASLLREEGADEGPRGVLHCFSSGRGLAEDGLSLGFYLSFSGILTFKTAQELREIAKSVPMDRLLVETDAPYLAPIPYRGKVNEPAYVIETLKCLAEIKGVTPGQMADATTQNFFRLFPKAQA